MVDILQKTEHDVRSCEEKTMITDARMKELALMVFRCGKFYSEAWNGLASPRTRGDVAKRLRIDVKRLEMFHAENITPFDGPRTMSDEEASDIALRLVVWKVTMNTRKMVRDGVSLQRTPDNIRSTFRLAKGVGIPGKELLEFGDILIAAALKKLVK